MTLINQSSAPSSPLSQAAQVVPAPSTAGCGGRTWTVVSPMSVSHRGGLLQGEGDRTQATGWGLGSPALNARRVDEFQI